MNPLDMPTVEIRRTSTLHVLTSTHCDSCRITAPPGNFTLTTDRPVTRGIISDSQQENESLVPIKPHPPHSSPGQVRRHSEACYDWVSRSGVSANSSVSDMCGRRPTLWKSLEKRRHRMNALSIFWTAMTAEMSPVC